MPIDFQAAQRKQQLKRVMSEVASLNSFYGIEDERPKFADESLNKAREKARQRAREVL